MRKLSLMLAIAVAFASTPAMADFTFPTEPGPFSVTAGTGATIGFNDAGNAAGVTSDLYGSFVMTADWVADSGDPWSSEAEILLTTSAGSFEVDPPTAGGASNGDATTLTFSGQLPGLYDPDVDGTLDVFMDQSFGGSTALWSNVSLTLESFVAPPAPSTAGTLTTNGALQFDTFTDADYGAGEVLWLELNYSGSADLTIDTEGTTGPSDTEIGLYNSLGFLVGADDDGGTDLLSSITFSGLEAGTYYIAASTFNTDFGFGFNVTTDGTETGPLTVNAFTGVPEPGSVAVLAMAAVGMFVRRRRG